MRKRLNTFGIRREDPKKAHEMRAAITPAEAAHLTASGAALLVQPAHYPATGEQKRIFPDQAYAQAGATITEDLSEADVIFGIKEVPLPEILPDKAYLFFSHTHKGQQKNRPMLQTLMERRATVIDYELITDRPDGNRLITAFTYFAGYAGMIDSLWTLGRRLAGKGISNPFEAVPQSVENGDLGDIKRILGEVGQHISTHGTPANRPPLITAFLGKGKTSHGAQSIYDLLPVREIALHELAETFHSGDRRFIYKLVLHIPELYRLRENDAERRAALGQEGFSALYKAQPELFESNLDQVFPYITLLMNCVLWSPKFPRMLTREDVHAWWKVHQTLEVIGDISCDPDGSVQFSRETWVTNPVFVYNPDTDQDTDGFDGEGIAVMAITNLPCEFSADASQGFCENLHPLLGPLLEADFSAPDPASAGLSDELARATILWQGRLTPDFAYMEAYVPQLVAGV